MAANVLAYFTEGDTSAICRSTARGQAPGLGSGEFLAARTQHFMPRLSTMY